MVWQGGCRRDGDGDDVYMCILRVMKNKHLVWRSRLVVVSRLGIFGVARLKSAQALSNRERVIPQRFQCITLTAPFHTCDVHNTSI